MKQLTCEMCGSTELIKQDGFFVCQTCGCKYSVEEAKKMMIEGTVNVQGDVRIQNTAQLENLLNLAHSSFDSKNYSQAENFCNQVIAMDDKNYDAWKLKGEAINYQITSDNPRILEVYNCIMTSYRILDEQSKEDKKEEILESLKKCFEGEIVFWLEQFEACRPTDIALLNVKNAYLGSYNKIAAAFDELGMTEAKNDYLIKFDNLFIEKANAICYSAWKTTVGYNYYRDAFGNLGQSWGRANTWSRLVSTDTDSYRPMYETAMTFIEEVDNLISLLEFAEEQFNDQTPCDSKENLYSNIIFLHERLCNLVYYKIDSVGYDVGWCEAGTLKDSAIAIRKNSINSYKRKIEVYSTTANFVGSKKDTSISTAIELLKGNCFKDAVKQFNEVIKNLPDERIGYIGKALALSGTVLGTISSIDDSHPRYDDPSYWAEFNAPTYECIEIAKSKIVSNEYRDATNTLINFTISTEYYDVESGLDFDYENSLLTLACEEYQLNAVRALIDMGADVNAKIEKVTPLYKICANPLPHAVIEAGREIAKLLIDNGAIIDIIAENGKALYNTNTDFEIARMIKEKYPDAQMGASSGSSSASNSSSSGGGCYVATAVYGSYDCPQVWTLRRYRDYTLAESWYGRAFIKTYYAISPTLVKWFGHTEWFKKMWQGKLDHMVAKLQANGVESTPYEDKNW